MSEMCKQMRRNLPPVLPRAFLEYQQYIQHFKLSGNYIYCQM